MEWIYLSPHLDDVALSCGGLVWEQARSGTPVHVWTVCAGDPPPGPLTPFAAGLHARWEADREAVEKRRLEDLQSCRQLGAVARHLSLPDCIYRRSQDGGAPLYDSEQAIFGPLHPEEGWLVGVLSEELVSLLPEGAELVCPLTIGGHADHRLVRLASERLGHPLWYYADYPYVAKDASLLDQLRQEGWESVRFPVSVEGLEAWVRGIAAHASQVSTFWPDEQVMQQAIAAHSQGMGGVELWRKTFGVSLAGGTC